MEKTPDIELNRPWLVAVWPGMGHVAINAGYYLVAKLGMRVLAEFSARELFEADHVEVDKGLIRSGRMPRSRFFVWRDPAGERDLLLFVGEAQPPAGKYAFCAKLINFAQSLGVEHVFTFAAMATKMHPEHDARIFGAAIDQETLEDLRRLELDILEDGQISGLNGVLLGVAAESDLKGACLLGEMPHIFSNLPFPKASLAVLDAFATMARLAVDLSELAAQAKAVDKQLGQALAKIEEAYAGGQLMYGSDGEPYEPPPDEERGLSDEQREKIETLFAAATADRSKAYELKRELDRLNVFDDYEDRFLDLFAEPD